MYDIAIIGAGPAGATLARLIGKQYRVLLIEQRRLPDHSDDLTSIKCCGGLLAPDAQMMLSKLRRLIMRWGIQSIEVREG